MKIAITGASGFIGQELIALLSGVENTEVIALTRAKAGKDSDTAHCKWCATDYSVESLTSIFADSVDAVIHLAGVRGTENDPEHFATNEEMIKNILQAMEDAGVRRIVFASTMSVYSGDRPMPWSEDAKLGGRSAYGDSKIACEKLIQKYTGQISYAIVRIAQVLGFGEKRRGVMNVFIDTAREHGALKVMGKSVARKQYIYVKDLCEVLSILAIGNERVNTDDNIIVNVGMPDVYTNLELAHIVNEVFDNLEPIDYDDTYSETNRAFEMDITKLSNEMGYEPMDMRAALRDIRNNEHRQ